MVHGIPVHRFPVAVERDPIEFAKWSEKVFTQTAFAARRAGLARCRGADQPGAGRAHQGARSRLRLLHLLQLPLSPLVPRRARGAGEGDPGADRRARRRARARHVSAGVPRRARVHVQLVRRARADSGRRRTTSRCRAWSSASDRRFPSARTPARFRQKFDIRDRFAIYVGRIDENKGCVELFDFFEHYSASLVDGMHLVLIGTAHMPIPEASAHPPPRLRRRPGQVRRDGGGRAADHAVVSREPVDGGARSVGDGQARARQREVRRAAGPVPAQQRRAVLRELPEFAETLRAIDTTPSLQAALGRNGRDVLRAPLRVAGDRARSTSTCCSSCRRTPAQRHDGADAGLVRAAAANAAAGGRSSSSLPVGPYRGDATRERPAAGRHRHGRRATAAAHRRGRRRPLTREPARRSPRAAAGSSGPPSQQQRPAQAARVRSSSGRRKATGPLSSQRQAAHRQGAGPIAAAIRGGRPHRRGRRPGGARRRPLSMPVAIHQVLATLGYGDAIGHEVLGIQRVLRGAGYESEIFVADRRSAARGPDARLSRPARRQPSRQHPDPPLLDRLARVADGVRAARSDGARLPQHHAAGVLRRRQQAAGAAVLSRAAASWRFYATRCDLALGDSEYNRQELEALGFPPTGVLPVVPDFSHLAGPAELHAGRRVRRRLGQRAVCRPRDSRTSGSRTSSAASTPTSAGSTRARGCCWSARTPASSATWRCCSSFIARHRRQRRALPRPRRATKSWPRTTSSPTCSSARSEHEGFCVPLVESFHMGVPVLAYAATAVPATMDGAGVLYHGQGSAARRGADRRGRRRSRRCRIGSSTARTRRSIGSRRKDFAGTLLVRRPGARRAAPAASAGRLRFLGSGRSWREELEELEAYRPAAFQALPRAAASTRRHGAVDDRQPVGPGGASRRRHRRLRAPRAGPAARAGAPVRHLRADDRRRPARRRACRGPMPARRAAT